MAIKKSQLYASLWQSCDELRGGMDASQYKDYILTLLFMKYVTDKAANDPYGVIVVPEGGSFNDMVDLIGDKDIGEGIDKIISTFAKENGLIGVIDQAFFNDDSKLGTGKAKQDLLSKLIGIFNNLDDLSGNRAQGDDLLGDAYEYLMRHFATQSGKSKGQFYTPAEVSRIMAKVIGINPDTPQEDKIYDPTCGSGSLLLKAADEAPIGITVYGQEKDNSTFALARMNMILHNHPTAEIQHGNTLTDPHFTENDRLRRFDFAVANPPFSDKAWTNGLNPEHDEYHRFDGYSIPPAKNGDYAFLLHFIASLKSTGKGAIILPHGVLFRGNKEADIRRKLIERGYIKGIIGLPANLFYGTGIPACIIVIDKENANHRTGIFMIDASKGFLKDGNKNRLRAQDIHKIVTVFNAQTKIDRYSRMVPTSDIADPANDYNLNIPRYIDNSDPDDLHDLDAHLNGGIPDTDLDALDDYWQVFPTLRQKLFKANGRPGYSDPLVESHQIKTSVLSHNEFKDYQEKVTCIYEKWVNTHSSLLNGINDSTKPRNIINTISEDLLNQFHDTPLIDPYDVYQKLMDYWDEVMQDDVYLICSDGWVDAAKPRDIIQDKNVKEIPDLTIKKKKYKMDLIPPTLIIKRFYADEQAEIDALQTSLETTSQMLEAFEEEHGNGEGALVGLEGSQGKITKENVQQRVIEHRDAILKIYPNGTPQHTQAKSIKKTTFGDSDWIRNIKNDGSLFKEAEIPIDYYDEEGLFEELDVLHQHLQLTKAVKAKKEAHKNALAELHLAIFEKYEKLTEPEIKTLVVKDKWFSSIHTSVETETQRIAQGLNERVKELDERYAHPLPELERGVEVCSAKVKEHLNKIGMIGHKEGTMQSLLTGKIRLPGFSGDWETKRLGEIASFFKGSSLFTKTDMSLDGKRRCIHYGELFTTYGEYISEVLHGTDRDEAFFLSVSNDVLMPASDVTPNGLATASCIGESDIILGGDILVIRFPAEILNGVFLAYTIKIHRNQVMQLVTGTTVYHLYGRDMANFKFDLPSIQEQNTIVEVLSDMDIEITALEQRRDKTIAIKQGMMQQLLTGKVRLLKSE